MGTFSPLIVTTIDRGFASLEAKKEKSDCGLISVLFVSYEYGLGVNSEKVTRAHWFETSPRGLGSYAMAWPPMLDRDNIKTLPKRFRTSTTSPLFAYEPIDN